MSTDDAADPGDTVSQEVGGDARVNYMVGVVRGNALFYQIDGEPSPERKYEVGRHYLDGGVPREAERLIGDALMSGCTESGITYYWTLAILSGRSLAELSDVELDQLETALRRSRSDGGWHIYVDLVHRLVFSRFQQRKNLLKAALEDYERLPEDRRDEIRRHLDLVLTGGVKDQAAAQDAAAAARLRMAGDRERRATLFFEADPQRPRLLPATPTNSAPQRTALVVGAVLVLLGLYLAAGSRPPATTMTLAGLLLGFAGCAGLAGFLGFGLLTDHAGRALHRARLAGWSPGPPESVLRYRTMGWEDFADSIDELVDKKFEVRAPKDKKEAEKWRAGTVGIRATLKREIAAQFATSEPLPKPEALQWLVRWHIDQFKSPSTKPHEAPAVSSARQAGVFAVAAAAVVFFAVAALYAVRNGGPFAVLGVGGALLAAAGGAGILHDAARRGAEADYRAQRLRVEIEAFHERVDELSERPTDMEMATWLDHDKAHIRAIAMQEFGLSDGDVIARVVVTGPNMNTRRIAWVPHGPLRYSVYDVELFLLTANGVWQFAAHLNMSSGAVGRERRKAFRYDAVTSAESDGLTFRLERPSRRW